MKWIVATVLIMALSATSWAKEQVLYCADTTSGLLHWGPKRPNGHFGPFKEHNRWVMKIISNSQREIRSTTSRNFIESEPDRLTCHLRDGDPFAGVATPIQPSATSIACTSSRGVAWIFWGRRFIRTRPLFLKVTPATETDIRKWSDKRLKNEIVKEAKKLLERDEAGQKQGAEVIQNDGLENSSAVIMSHGTCTKS